MWAAASPLLVVPGAQFYWYLRDGVWYHLNTISVLRWQAALAIQGGHDPEKLPVLLAWSLAPRTWTGLHTILGWIPLLLIILVISGLVLGGLAINLFEEAVRLRA